MVERTDIIFTRAYLPLEEEYGFFAKVGSVELSNGLCYLAAMTRSKGYKTKVLDGHVLNLSNKELAERIIKKNPKYLGISSDTINIHSAADLAKRVKSANSKIITILGGPHITAVPKETMRKFPWFDIGVLREGELTIIDLLDTSEASKELSLSKSNLNKVKGIIFRKNKKLIVTEPRDFIKDLDILPLPAWDLLPSLSKYHPPAWSLHQKASALLMTSRGCSNQCIFCDRAVFGHICRAHSTKYVMKMIRTLHGKYSINHFRILDDNFVLFRKRLIEICDKIIKEKLDITWSCYARADCVSPEILKLMKKAGCWQISYGIESGEKRILDVEKKNISLEQIAQAVKWTREAKIRIIGFNMIGHPLETEEHMQKTIDFNKKIKVDDFKTTFLVPYPGTELYRTGKKYGTFDKDWRQMGAYKGPCFIPHGLTKEKIVHYHKKGFLEFYSQPRIILSYVKQIKSFNDVKALFLGLSVLISMIFKKNQ